jgi:hypothetical protein
LPRAAQYAVLETPTQRIFTRNGFQEATSIISDGILSYLHEERETARTN